MKNSFIKTLLLLMIIFISCHEEGAKGYSGLDDFSGKYKFYYKLPSSYDCPLNGITFSINDLEISSNGRFKRKMYFLNENNECVVSEILEGKITITHPNKTTPRGIIEYDNLEVTEEIVLDWSTNGKHHEVTFDTNDGAYHYYRTD